jgi:hypothetical protein
MMNTTQGDNASSPVMQTAVCMSAVTWEQKPGKGISSGSEVEQQTAVGHRIQHLCDVHPTSQTLSRYGNDFPTLSKAKQGKRPHKMKIFAKLFSGEVHTMSVNSESKFSFLKSQVARTLNIKPKFIQFLHDDEKVEFKMDSLVESILKNGDTICVYVSPGSLEITRVDEDTFNVDEDVYNKFIIKLETHSEIIEDVFWFCSETGKFREDKIADGEVHYDRRRGMMRSDPSYFYGKSGSDFQSFFSKMYPGDVGDTIISFFPDVWQYGK